MKKNNYRLLIGLLALLLTCLNAFPCGATVVNSTWLGDGSPNFFNGEWSDAALWNPNGTPNDAGGTVYDVTIPYDEAGFIFNGPTLDIDATIQNLTLVSRAVVDNQINNGTNLTVTGSTTFSTSPGGDYGVITAAGNSTFNLGTLTNYNATTKTLEGARFSAYIGATIAFRGADVVTNNGELLVGGTGSRIINQDTGANAFANIAVNNFSFSIENGLSFTTAGDFTNNASLSVRSGTNVTGLTISGSLTNYNAATFTLSGGSFFLDGPGTATLRFAGADIRVLSGVFVTLDGAGSAITDLLGNNALRNLERIESATLTTSTQTFTPLTGTLINLAEQVVLPGGTVTVQGDYVVNNSGTTTISAPTENADTRLVVNGSALIQSGSIGLGEPGPSAIYFSKLEVSDGIEFDGGTARLTGTGIVIADTLFTNGASLVPGQSAGQLTYQGALTLDPDANLEIQIGGVTAGTEFDQVVQQAASHPAIHYARMNAPHGGGTTLGGTLDVSLIDGFEGGIQNTDTFVILTSDQTLSGVFDNVASGDRLNTSDGFGSFLVTYAGQNEVTLSDFEAVLQVTSSVSRKTHGAAGNFDVNLPLTGTPGVECRNGGGTNDYTMVVTFASNVTVTGSPQAQVTSGTGTIGSGGVSNGGMVTVSGNTVTIPLTNVADQQTINVTLNSVNNASASDAPSASVVIPMSRLLGDTNGNRAVNSTDASQSKSRIGQTLTTANFRSDVNNSGGINSTDVSIIKSNTGHGLP